MVVGSSPTRLTIISPNEYGRLLAIPRQSLHFYAKPCLGRKGRFLATRLQPNCNHAPAPSFRGLPMTGKHRFTPLFFRPLKTRAVGQWHDPSTFPAPGSTLNGCGNVNGGAFGLLNGGGAIERLAALRAFFGAIGGQFGP